MKSTLLLQKAETLLRNSQVQSPRLESELLLAHVLSCSRIELYGSKFDEIEDSKAEDFLKLVRRRAQKEPVAHLLGFKEFMGLSFRVSPDTLIPRPETELLVLAVEKYFPQSEKNVTLLDLGTGSGCIALSLAKRNPHFSLEAIDFSSKALNVAQQNASQLGVEPKRLSFKEDDVLSKNFWESSTKVHAIVSNPPYIGYQEKPDLEDEVLVYEPSSALFAKNEGLLFYETYAENARDILMEKGLLFLELSPLIYERVVQVFREKNWELVETITDYAGHKRHIVLR